MELLKGSIEPIASNLINYFVPGFLCLAFYDYITGHKINKSSHAIIFSVALSIVLDHVLTLLLLQFKISAYEFQYYYTVLFVFALFAGWVSALFVNSNWIIGICRLIKIPTTPQKTIWHEVFDFKLGCYVEAYSKDDHNMYAGELVKFNTEGNEGLILVLKSFSIYTKPSLTEFQDNDYEAIEESFVPTKAKYRVGDFILVSEYTSLEHNTNRLVLKADSIDHFIIVYNDNSAMIKNTRAANQENAFVKIFKNIIKTT